MCQTVDDVVVNSDTWEQHVRLLEIEFGKGVVTYLGKKKVHPLDAKVQVISSLVPTPQTKHKLKFVLSMAGCSFCKYFLDVVLPLASLLLCY